MPCTKSLPGNEARQISLLCSCARNSAPGPQTLAHLQGVFWLAWRPPAAGVVLVLIDNFWPVSNQHSSFHPSTFWTQNILNACQPTAPILLHPSPPLQHPLNYWALSFKGTSSSHQMCRPSSLLHRSFTRSCNRPHVASWHWGNHSHAPHLLLTPPLAPSQSFFKLAPS